MAQKSMDKKTQSISKEELDERIAILKRFKAILEEQRTKFQEYLRVLEKQHSKIETGDSESALIHSRMEENIVRSINTLQKVAIPLESLYNNFSNTDIASKTPIQALKTELNLLKSKVIEQNSINQTLLKKNIQEVKEQIADTETHNPYKKARSIYAQAIPTANVVQLDI
ncbi:MAG: flagellar biosynthesis protein FlgN [Treponema sp.]|nr:flagellar biosynthesis protein FlgN [Treponema sp.]